jgi:hypothetical protein
MTTKPANIDVTLVRPKRLEQSLTVRVVSKASTANADGLFETTDGQRGEFLNELGLLDWKRVKVGTIIDIKAYALPVVGLVWVAVAPHYSNYSA